MIAVNANGDSCDIYENIYLEPHFIDPSGLNFNLMSISPCIDAGDPALPLDPDGSIVDIGAISYIIPQAPDIAFSVTELLFPETQLGQFTEIPLIIYNYGALNLVIDSMTALSYPDVFTVDWDPVNNVIVSMDSLAVTAQFTPGEVLEYDDIIFVYNNDELGVLTVSGAGISTSADPRIEGRPFSFTLQPAYPNPFNPVTELQYSISEPGNVSLAVYDVSGAQISMLAQGWHTPGAYNVRFEARDLPSGVYFAKLSTGNRQFTQKLMLLK